MSAIGHYVVESDITNWPVAISAECNFATTDVVIATDKVTVSVDIATGSLITFSSSGALPVPLVHGTHYYAIRVDSTHIKVAANPVNATAGTPVDITTVGSGVHHVDVGEGSSTAARQETIDRAENIVEFVTHDVFYSKAFVQILDGNDGDRLFIGLRQEILDVTKVESSGVEIPIDYIAFDSNAIFLNPEVASSDDLVEFHFLVKHKDILFPEGTGNIVVTGTCGHAACPPGIKKAVIILCQVENDSTLYQKYSHFDSESVDGYGYTKSKYITGVVEADKELVPFIVRRPVLGAI